MPLKLTHQDITKIQCDAIVNAMSEVDANDAVITDASGSLYKHVIHTAKPKRTECGGLDNKTFEACYLSSLSLAVKNNCESVALPLISYTNDLSKKDEDLKTAMNAIETFLKDNEMTVYLSVGEKASYEYSAERYSKIIRYMDMCGTNLVNTVSSSKAKAALEELERERQEQRRKREEEWQRALEEEIRRDRARRANQKVQPTQTVQRIEGKTLWRPMSPQKRTDQQSDSGEMRTVCNARRIEMSQEHNVHCLHLDERPWKLDKSFAETLFMFIDRSGMSDVECYKRANVDRKTFSKIKCNKDYRPSKATAVSFAIALRLNLFQTNMLLATLGMTLSNSIEFDVIIKYFIERKEYDINVINETLFEFDQVLLGS